VTVGWQPIPHLMSCLIKFLLPSVGHFQIRSLSLSPECPSPSKSLVHSGGGCPTSYFLRLPFSILSAGPQGFSPFLSPNTRSCPLLPPPFPFTHFTSQVPPFLPICDCFLLSPKWDWGVLTWALSLVDLFEFYGLYIGYSVLFFVVCLYGWLVFGQYPLISMPFWVWVTSLRVIFSSSDGHIFLKDK
jgi:hypothetical protein